MEKINYIIATWAGNRRAPNNNYLRHHLLKLLSLKHNLAQITIVKPIFNGYNSCYYEVDDLIKKFDCKVVVLERYSNEGQSYGQLFFAYETFKDEFDYYIFIEDDYLPNIDNFDSLLKHEYEIQKVNGYLCSFAEKTADCPDGGCSVSNGIISTKYMEEIYKKNDSPIKRIDGNEGYMCHQNFASLIFESGLFFKDFASNYRVPYYGTSIIEYGRKDISESIFVPHQLLEIDVFIREMKIEDIPTFLEIRNECKEYLHNNSHFTLEESIKWFNDTNPNFYIIEFGGKTIGYFRTSNLNVDEKTIYLGCDIHSDYRGYGLAYISYLKFIKILYKKFDLNSIKLEVLSTNYRAINLYNKLGFRKKGISGEKIKRNNIEIDSIIMEFKK